MEKVNPEILTKGGYKKLIVIQSFDLQESFKCFCMYVHHVLLLETF